MAEEPLTVNKIQKADLHVVTYTDGSGQQDTRFVAVFGGQMVFLLPDNGDKRVAQPAGWLKKDIARRLNLRDPDAKPEIPEDKVTPDAVMGA